MTSKMTIKIATPDDADDNPNDKSEENPNVTQMAAHMSTQMTSPDHNPK
jgi:hypothetical protein